MDKSIIPSRELESKILLLRGHKVMLSHDLAGLYQVGTKVLNQAVKRNLDRFPPDFMFRLTKAEMENLRSQFVTSSWGGHRYEAFAFTEHGVAMLSSVLKSGRAVKVNILVIRAFVRLRNLIESNKGLSRRLDALEQKYDAQFKSVFDAIRALIETPGPEPKRIEGFKP